MGSFKQLNISAQANKGIEIPVTIPGGNDGEGVITGDVLVILSTYSERFRKAEAEGFRKIREAMRNVEEENGSLNDSVYEEIALNSIAHLVSEWSYDEPCTQENVKEFLDANPHMYDIINRKAADHAAFFVDATNNC